MGPPSFESVQGARQQWDGSRCRYGGVVISFSRCCAASSDTDSNTDTDTDTNANADANTYADANAYSFSHTNTVANTKPHTFADSKPRALWFDWLG